METKILGLKPIKEGDILHLKDGNFKLKNIEVINMMVDRFDFENRESNRNERCICCRR